VRKASREECVLGLSFVTRKSQSTSSRRVRATPTQERKRSSRAAAAENSRELDRIVHGYPTEFRVWHGAGVRSKAKNSGALIRENLGECGAIREVLVQNLSQLGVRDAEFLAPDSGHISDAGMVKCVTKSVAADHSSRAHDD
jgi:hypothetical protein